MLEWLVKRGNKVFVDLKFFDVPETVRAAVRGLRNRGLSFATVHGNQAMLEAAGRDKGDVKILAVTVLTSLDRGDLDDLGFDCDVERLVLSRARRGLLAECYGVISSGLEAPALKRELGPRLLVVTPGIRPAENRPLDDQKRTVDVAQAFANGADYIVVGRPIRQASDARAAAQSIQESIARVLRTEDRIRQRRLRSVGARMPSCRCASAHAMSAVQGSGIRACPSFRCSAPAHVRRCRARDRDNGAGLRIRSED